MSDEKINIKFSKDEAIVLFEFLSRFSDKDKLNIEHQAEERVLWNLTCSFEKELAEPFLNKHGSLFRSSKRKVKRQS